VKKRTSAHEDTIREYQIDRRGLTLGEPLVNFQGVLRGVPSIVDEGPALLKPASRRGRAEQGEAT
jgi:circadian clock protein KaiC